MPYLGVYLTDLTFIEDGIPDKIKHTTAAGDDGAPADSIAANETKRAGAQERLARTRGDCAHICAGTAQWRW